MTSRALQIAEASDREKTAERLLRSSADKFYDPEIDIDWDAPLAAGKAYQPEHRITLYGTPLWHELTPEQRIELGKHEIASVASVGLWFELVLMQALLKEAYHSDPTSRHAQYALAEVADEWLQPLIRMVNRIHVLEEARHVTFARQEVVRGMASLSRAELAYQRMVIAHISYLVMRSLVHPRVYLAVGLDPREARRTALGNPHYQETIRWSGERIVKFLDDVGLVGPPGMRWWRKSFLLPAQPTRLAAAA